jgi:hypothetical protein
MTRPDDPAQAPRRRSWREIAEERQHQARAELEASLGRLSALLGTTTNSAPAGWPERREAPGVTAALTLRPAPLAIAGVAPGPRPLVTVLPLLAPRIAGRVRHPKIHAGDIRDVPRIRTPDFLRRCRAAGEQRQKGDPLIGSLMSVAAAIQRAWTMSAHAARRTLVQLADGAGLVAETARKCLRYLERAGLVDTINVLIRRDVDGSGVVRLVRDANLLLPGPVAEARADVDASVDASPEPLACAPLTAAPAFVDRAASTIARWAGRFGLAVRAEGWQRRAAPA